MILKTGYRHLMVALLSTAFLAGCQSQQSPSSTSSQAQAPPPLKALALVPGKVEPGVGIEEVKLGQTRAEVENSLGSPDEQDANEFAKGQTYLLYHKSGIELTLQDDKVEMITIHPEIKKWSAYAGATAEGVGVTSTGKEVEEALGPADEDAPRALRYASKGIVFRFDRNREGDGSNARAESVSVVAPAAAE